MNNKALRRYQIKNEVWSAITHGIGFSGAILALVLLILKACHLGPLALCSYIVFGVSMVVLYFSSMLYHCLSFTKAARVLQVFDHSSIFLLIAGSYTPFCLTIIKGWLGIGLLTIIWSVCLLGIIYKIFFVGKFKNLETILYVILGWACVVGIKPLWLGLGSHGICWLALGGIIYTSGALLYSAKKIPYAHVFWHILVMLGSLCMFIALYCYG
ncbi:MAG: hemolysin III family protein [Candidatus Paralactobacillus gallistercoris]|uniref:Hemolysin III family protein n=1 Tax=Candidatus Paralactobacillus gallistercoris TaxID=2838724 RepID=A0A948X137_9LACO|nr:hemolysin III family protein [Candidatus Paralactobacillus gallistercoris]